MLHTVVPSSRPIRCHILSQTNLAFHRREKTSQDSRDAFVSISKSYKRTRLMGVSSVHHKKARLTHNYMSKQKCQLLALNSAYPCRAIYLPSLTSMPILGMSYKNRIRGNLVIPSLYLHEVP